MTNKILKQVQDFINSQPPENNARLIEYDRYENIIEVIYMIDMADGSRRTRTKYLRVTKDEQMSDTTCA